MDKPYKYTMLLEELIRNEPNLPQILEDFLPLAMAELGLEKLPRIQLVKQLKTSDQPSFGRYLNGKALIQMGIANRHPLDIIRTLAHELTHFKQDLEGRINPRSGETGSPEENEAHEVAGILMRKFGKKFPQYFSEKPIIFEARGLFARQEGDEFKDNTTGEIFQFNGITKSPNNAPAFDSPLARDEALTPVLKQPGIIEVNRKNNAMLGFAVANFTSQDGTQVRNYLKYFSDVGGDMHGKWLPSAIPGLTSVSKAAEKAQAGLKPQDTFAHRKDVPEKQWSDEEEEVKKAKKAEAKKIKGHKFSSDGALVSALNSIPDDKLDKDIKEVLSTFSELPIIFKNEGSAAAITDNLGEIVQALAFTRGLVENNDTARAKEAVLGEDVEWGDLGIYFPGGKTAGLVDFYLTADGNKLGVSSKSGSGASASAQNLWDCYSNLNDEDRSDFKKKYPETIHTLHVIMKGYSGDQPEGTVSTALESPLVLAVEYGLLSEVQAKEARKVYHNNPPGTESDPKIPDWAKKMAHTIGVKPTSNWHWGWRLLSAIARDVADEINKDKNFTKGLLELLKKSAMMQVHSQTSVTKDQVKFTGFTVKYPAVFTGTIKLTHEKNYASTEKPKGRYTFKFV